MTDEIKNTNETKPSGLTEVVKPAFKADADAGLSKLTEKLAEPTKPVAPKPEPVKEVKPVAKDPKGMFDYSNCKQYVVQQGDTLLDVAQKFCRSTSTIALLQPFGQGRSSYQTRQDTLYS